MKTQKMIIVDRNIGLTLTICYTILERVRSLTVEAKADSEEGIVFCESFPKAFTEDRAGFAVQSIGLVFFNDMPEDSGDILFRVPRSLCDAIETLTDTDASFSVTPLSDEIGFVIRPVPQQPLLLQ